MEKYWLVKILKITSSPLEHGLLYLNVDSTSSLFVRFRTGDCVRVFVYDDVIAITFLFFVPIVVFCSACKKVLNSGLGPFKDQTAEMVLFWSFFLHKKPFFLLAGKWGHMYNI